MNAAERFISFCGVSSEAPRGAELLSVYTELGQALYHDHRKRAPGKTNEDILARFLVSCLVEAGGSWCIQRFTKLGSVRLCLEDVFWFLRFCREVRIMVILGHKLPGSRTALVAETRRHVVKSAL